MTTTRTQNIKRNVRQFLKEKSADMTPAQADGVRTYIIAAVIRSDQPEDVKQEFRKHFKKW